jgi:hypothetical protein
MLFQLKNQCVRVLGNTVTPLVLAAVPLFALAVADSPPVSQPALVQATSSATLQVPSADDSVILNNWQFTAHHHGNHGTGHHKNKSHHHP